MSPFDQQRAYAEQEDDVFFDDGREIELLHFVYSRPDIDRIRGSPARVLAAIDEYARTKKYLMNVGELKGKVVTDLIGEKRPEVMVELGGYVGYSCILFADALRRAGGRRYYTLERNPEFAAVIMSLVHLAGLSSLVEVVVGPSDDGLRRLASSEAADPVKRVDLLFLDHYKPAYVTDLKLCEELGLVGPGSVLAADNVVKPGNPPYLAYVRSSVEEKKRAAAAEDKNSNTNGKTADEFGRYANQYESREGKEVLDARLRGNPELVYESRLVESFEPTGVPDALEITTCVG